MKKLLKLVCLLLLVAGAFYFGTVVSDKMQLKESVIRLHVVADSDSTEDQAVKLQVRDALIAQLDGALGDFRDLESAKLWLEQQLPELEKTANEVLRQAGSDCTAQITLGKEAFPTREYDTFTLPAGVYESLRVTIGSGEGKNWWCVVFPNLCFSAAADNFEDTAVSAGFSDRLTGTISGQQEYQVRFFLMDCFGWLENWFHSI